MNEFIDKTIKNPKILDIISWVIFIGGNIIYVMDIIPKEWSYIFGLFIGASFMFFDILAIFVSKLSEELEEEYAKIDAEYEAKHQARVEEFEKLKKEYGIDDED